MGWLDDLLREFDAAPAQEPAKTRQPKPEIKTLWFQTAGPHDGDAGGCEPGFYSVADGVVTMHDESGNPTGKTQRLGPDDDARQIAGRLARASWLKSDAPFNRPLNYPTIGVA